MNNAPFYIGQKVVVVKDHSMGVVKKGNVFTVKLIRKVCCKWGVDVGLFHDRGFIFCGQCKYIETTDVAWFDSGLFAPIEENTYENISKKLAVLPQDEVPDVKEIKELVN